MHPSVFLGLVTHRGTRFPQAAGPQGLVAQVNSHLADLGVGSVVSIHEDDHHEASLVPLTRSSVTASINAELGLEQRWRSYVDPEASGTTLALIMGLRRAYRMLRLAPPWSSRTSATPAGARMLTRLVNIELAHLHLLHQAVESRATWALIVEDDATLGDPRAFATALVAFMSEHGADAQPDYVNVSRSFEDAELGIASHLTPVGAWSPTVRMLAADRPLTNTVCAILYRGTFLQDLVPALDAIPVQPVLPIDWKLNAALLALADAGRLGPGSCWFLDPGPIAQGSMHTDAD